MLIKGIKKYLSKQNIIPDTNEEKKKWLSLDDVLNFFLQSRDGMIPIYISQNRFFVYSLIVPENNFHNNNVKELLNWNFGPSSGYSHGYNYNKKIKEPCLYEPMNGEVSEILDKSIPIFFHRFFEGHKSSSFLEINQKISHILEIFWLEERKTFCRINKLGDYEDIATMEDDEDLTLCTLKKEDLEFYLFLSRSVLVRFFNLIRVLNISEFRSYKERKEELYSNKHFELYAKKITQINKKGKITAAWIRGFQLIHNTASDHEMIKKLNRQEDREYASFIIWDWKNKKVCKWSSDPKMLGNYYVESKLPFEISPAFFRSEVLSKYKQDPSKYTIEDRKITCRGSWSLEYDINEEGQVHAYIYDLSRLPYQEQLYLSSFNEEPKAGISKRAFKTDFMASWGFDYDPLFSLKQILEKFPVTKVKNRKFHIWKMPNLPETRDIKTLNYVVTDSIKEWENQILILAQILIDGLCTQSINKLAEYLGGRYEKLGSLKQLVKCFETLSIEKNEITIFSDPLLKLWKLRSGVVAHPGKSYPKGDLKKHYRVLIEDCDKAMRKLADFIDKGLLNIDKL